MASAERLPGLDLDRDIVRLPPVPIMGAVNEKATRPHWRQALQRLRHPVRIGERRDVEHRGVGTEQAPGHRLERRADDRIRALGQVEGYPPAPRRFFDGVDSEAGELSVVIERVHQVERIVLAE
jgi:hypothetical protein